MNQIKKKTKKHPTLRLNQIVKIQTQRENFKSSKGKETCHIEGSHQKTITDFPAESLPSRREWYDIFKVLKGKNELSTENPMYSKTVLHSEGEIKTFLDK